MKNFFYGLLGLFACFGAAGIAVFWLLMIIFVPVGYIANIVQLVNSGIGVIDVSVALKLVGLVFAPLGAVMGWIGIF